jgi:membrane-associated phospholipid phosphatase
MTCHWARTRVLLVGIALVTLAERVSPQTPCALAPAARAIEPAFPSWRAGELSAPSCAVAGPIVPGTGALPRLRWGTDGVVGAGSVGAYALSRGIGITRRNVPPQGLDPSNVSLGMDRRIIGRPSTGADKASDVTLVVTMVGAPVLALLTQPGVHGFANVVRRPLVLYGESLLLAEAGSQILKRSVDRPRPFTYLPASERPGSSAYDVDSDGAFLSMPSGHATISFTAASFAATDNLLSRPDAGWQEHVAVASLGALLAGATSNLRVRADQHFPSDVLVGGLIGTVSGASVPLLHRYVFPGGRLAPRPPGHAWLEAAAGYLLGAGLGVGLSSLAY